MSAYRDKPRPPAFRVVFQRPLDRRLREAAGVLVFALLAAGSALGFVLAVILGGSGSIGVAVPCLMVLGTSISFLVLTAYANRAEIAGGTIEVLASDPATPSCCEAIVSGTLWELPLSEDALREGETLEVRFRVVGPKGEPEILEVRVAAEG